MRVIAAIVFLGCLPILCQSNSGELRIQVTGPSGFGVRTTVHITCSANQYRKDLSTNDLGYLDIQSLP